LTIPKAYQSLFLQLQENKVSGESSGILASFGSEVIDGEFKYGFCLFHF
jgi:hypothetical protein